LAQAHFNISDQDHSFSVVLVLAGRTPRAGGRGRNSEGGRIRHLCRFQRLPGLRDLVP